jgi:glycosyltransferase involved in cell wall biosynthesis
VTPSPSFSIIVPTYQRRDTVCEAVTAFGRMKYDGPVEILVVIDGSTDGTRAALERHDCSFPLRVVEQPAKRGQAAARNRGARVATGDILLFLDDDMICAPDLVQQHALLLSEGADAVTGEIPIHQDSKPSLVADRLALAASWPRTGRASAFDVYSGNLSVRKSVFDELGGFDEDLRAGEDLELGIRLIDRFDVRHNSAAIAWQTNLISPIEHMKRARKLAAADLRLIAKHHQIAAELLAHRGAPVEGVMPAGFRLGRIPFLPAIAAAAAAGLAEMAQRTSFRLNPFVSRLYFTARSGLYWSAFRTPAGRAILSGQGHV